MRTNPDLVYGERPRVEPIHRQHVVIDERASDCALHGAFTSRLEHLQPALVGIDPFWTRCPTCDGEEQAQADARHAEIMGGVTATQSRIAARIAAAGIPARFREASVWNWQHPMDQQRRVWEWAREYCTHFEIALQTGRCGALIGSPGTGKTHLAIGVLRHILEKGGTGHYVTVMSMLGRIKDTFNARAAETERAVIQDLTTCDMLVVDEVGRSLDSNYEIAQFFRVLDTRYQHLRPTILVSNMTKPKLVEFLGDAAVDRLRESGGALLQFDWASQRSSRKPADAEGGAS